MQHDDTLSAKDERFAQLVAMGETQAAAYRKVNPRSKKWQDKTVWAKASDLARKVERRIAELRDASTTHAILSATEAKEILSKIARNHIDMREKLNDEDGIQIGERDVPNRDRIAAIDRLAKMQGWDAVEKTVTQIAVVTDQDRESLMTKLIAAQMRLKEPKEE